jgi:ABC-type sugar transport system permease subunit/ABC-type glycerol-3-phosphate transport system substrate-binding protein
VARLLLLLLVASCAAPSDRRVHIRYAGSAVGAEGEVLTRQIASFERLHPEIVVDVVSTPDSGDQRHQLYVQWLNAGASTPDVLQLDVIWTAELANAGWILPLPDQQGFFPQVLEANRWRGRLYAVPLFVDVGMLYWRTDLFAHAPGSLDELASMAAQAMRAGRVRYGLVLQAARYEGLVCSFLELLGGFGGNLAEVDSEPGRRALAWLRDAIDRGVVPREVLGWQEEHARFAFQNGDAAFMRNWPYAYPLLQDAQKSRVAGKFAVAAMPGRGATAALGGAELAINARTRQREAARLLVEHLTAPAQLIERARVAGQYPARPELYRSGALTGLVPIPPADALAIIEHAAARPVTPVYAEWAAALQVHLHRALSGQSSPDAALAAAAAQMKQVVARAERPAQAVSATPWLLLAAALLLALIFLLRRGIAFTPSTRLGWLLAAPATTIVVVFAILPLAWDVWESLHAHDLRLPAQGQPFVGLSNYAEIGADARFWAALAHTGVFMLTSVTLEIAFGLALALALHRLRRGRGAARAVSLLPWAIPTVIAALVWRFMFGEGWLVDATGAWFPLVLADVWKTTPFVALLFLAGRQGIDESLYDAARTDGASRFRQFIEITLPLLRPTLLVVLLFRSLDAFRVLDLVYVLTGGGPGTATEPVSLLAFSTLMRDLRFGLGAALSVIIFAIAALLAFVYVRWLGRDLSESRS